MEINVEEIPEIVFLDLDGVGNGHQRHENGWCGLRAENIDAINALLRQAPSLQVVISSSWRYWVHSGKMTMVGLEEVLQCFGLNVNCRLHGITESEDQVVNIPLAADGSEDWKWLETHGCRLRAIQIERYLLKYWPFQRVNYIVLDDLTIPIQDGSRMVTTDGAIGMTMRDVERALLALRSF